MKQECQQTNRAVRQPFPGKFILLQKSDFLWQSSDYCHYTGITIMSDLLLIWTSVSQ